MTDLERVTLALQRVDRALRSWTADVVIAGDLDLLHAHLKEDAEREELFKTAHMAQKAELARLRAYAKYADQAGEELGRLREALTLIGRYHYSTREAKDLCDIANDALKEPQETD